MNPKLSRRDLLVQTAALGVVAVAGANGCGKDRPAALSCSDTSALSAPEMTVRTVLAYVDTSAEPGKNCSNCQQFLPAAPDTCGACKVLKGPVSPKGYCKSFVARPA
ncbi:MAG: high-potential iron-sulfur protein [Myxococcota bacterium]|nr:high-potential iron-sulfur protein [Myxococcota bacterium]